MITNSKIYLISQYEIRFAKANPAEKRQAEITRPCLAGTMSSAASC